MEEEETEDLNLVEVVQDPIEDETKTFEDITDDDVNKVILDTQNKIDSSIEVVTNFEDQDEEEDISEQLEVNLRNVHYEEPIIKQSLEVISEIDENVQLLPNEVIEESNTSEDASFDGDRLPGEQRSSEMSFGEDPLSLKEEKMEVRSLYIVDDIMLSIVKRFIVELIEDAKGEVTARTDGELIDEAVDRSLYTGTDTVSDTYKTLKQHIVRHLIEEIVDDEITQMREEENFREKRESFVRELSEDETLEASESTAAEQDNQTAVHRPFDPEVLEPSNPLMIRFQVALKTHLTKQVDRFRKDILDLECELKGEAALEDSIAQKIYDVEMKINKQHTSLDKLLNDLIEISSNWDNAMNTVNQTQDTLKQKAEYLDELKKKDSELHIERESLSALIQQFTEWEATQSADISTAKQLTERQKSDKKKFILEKQKLDVYVFAIRKETLKLSTELSNLLKLIEEKMKEKQSIEQSVADSNSDLESMMCHNQQITSHWHKNIVLVKQRDKTLLDMKETLEKHKVYFKLLEVEEETTKRELQNLICENGRLTANHQLLNKLNLTHRKKLKEELEKQKLIRIKLSEITKMKSSTEIDLVHSEQDLVEANKKTDKTLMEWEHIKELNEKLEEDVITTLQKQAAESTATRILSNRIEQLRRTLREKEVAMADIENKIAKIMIVLEKEKAVFNCGEVSLKQAKQELNDKESEIGRLRAELNKTKTSVRRAQLQLDKCSCKLEHLKEIKGDIELSPEEIQIRELESRITHLDDQIEQSQQFWLRQQSHIVSLSQKRTQQLHKINVFRKQLIILDKKNLKIEHDINELEKESHRFAGVKALLQKKLVKLNEENCHKKGYTEMLANINMIKQNEYMSGLKDAEDESIALNNELGNIEEEKEELYNKISDLQKEILSWDKKCQMAVETRQLIEKLNSEGGELSNMKTEIHRMEVRYSQLCKTQEKLCQDMEMCVLRRDGIVYQALAREKRTQNGTVHFTKQQFTKKVEDIKNNLRHTLSNQKVVSKECTDNEEQKDGLAEKLQLKNDQLLNLKRVTEQMDLQLAEGHLHRQKNLEVLIRLQRKYQHYNQLRGSRYKLLFRNESSLEMESQKQKAINSHLITIVETLVNDFPNLQMAFTSILNSLRVSTSC